MAIKRISIQTVDGLKKLENEGGQGVIYILSPDKLIKIYPEEDATIATAISKRLQIIGNNPGIYRELKSFCAIPEDLVERPDNKQLVGFQMTHFKGFQSLGKLLDKMFCVESKLTIRKVVKIFLAMHDGISKIHANGLIIGDLNEDNILFKLNDKTVLLGFVDVDSWAIHHKNIKLPTSATTPTFCHPELEKNPEKLETRHDWYSFATLLTRSLIKNDPFNMGSLDETTMHSIKGASQENGITCWDSRVHLTDIDAIYTRRFGKSITNTLKNWLSGNQIGVFPKKVLEKFLDGLGFCKKCTLEVHIDHINCTRCGERLAFPVPNFHKKKTTRQDPKKKELSNLLASGG